MKKKESLFLLIKSLNQAEKRYFRVAAKQESANYLQLFLAIDNQERYDEVALKKLFKGEKFVNQLHVAKIYLQDLILKNLRNYHSKNSVSIQLGGLLTEIEILYDRELYDLCLAKIQKARSLAEQFDKFSTLLDIIFWERKLALVKFSSAPDLGKILMAERHVIERIVELNEYWKGIGGFQNSLSLPEASEFISKLKAQKPASLRANILHAHILFSSYLINTKFADAEHQLDLLINVLEQRPDYVQEDPGAYATAIGNKISLLLQMKRLEEIPSLISKIRSIPHQYRLKKDNKFTVRLWIRLFNLELELYRDKKDMKNGLVLMKEVDLFIQLHQSAIPVDYLLMLSYQFAHFLFMNKAFSQSLRWVNEIMSRNVGAIREDIQIYARIMNLIVHFELGNIIVIRYAVDNCRRFLRRIKKLGVEENLVLKFFSKLSHEPMNEHASLFQDLYNRLFVDGNGDIQNEFNDYIDLKAWVESKLKLSQSTSTVAK